LAICHGVLAWLGGAGRGACLASEAQQQHDKEHDDHETEKPISDQTPVVMHDGPSQALGDIRATFGAAFLRDETAQVVATLTAPDVFGDLPGWNRRGHRPPPSE
jgi:hypothetical protein